MRVLVVNNLRSGQGDARRYDLIAELCRRGVDVCVRPVDPEHTVDDAVRDATAFDTVVVVGGDGTVSTAAYALRETGVPMLVYPAGTANAVALNLGSSADPLRCVDAILEGSVARVDLGEITFEREHRPPRSGERRLAPRPTEHVTQGFVAIAGTGFDARLMERADDLKDAFGPGSYVLAALQDPAPKVARIELELDGKTVHTEGISVMLVNFGRMQFDLTVTHDSNAQDGMLEVVVIKARHIAELLPALLASYLDKIVTYPSRSQALDAYRAASVTVRCDPAMRVQADGEVLPGLTPLTCRVLPRAATFVVPARTIVPGVRLDEMDGTEPV
jgi:diacylglycerol kinase family enzyme